MKRPPCCMQIWDCFGQKRLAMTELNSITSLRLPKFIICNCSKIRPAILEKHYLPKALITTLYSTNQNSLNFFC